MTITDRLRRHRVRLADLANANRDPTAKLALRAVEADCEAAAPLIDEMAAALKLALEYWSDRQQRYKNRHPRWVNDARNALAKAEGREAP